MGRAKATTIDTPAYKGKAVIHFHPGKHKYTVSVPALGKEKVYQPGVTSIIGIKDKSGALCWWTAEQCEAYVLQVIEELFPNEQSLPMDLILKLLVDMKYHYRTVVREAQQVGRLVHDYLHRYLRSIHEGKPMPERPSFEMDISTGMLTAANNAIDAGLQFFSEHELRPITMEQPVWSPTYGYIGTDDFIGMVDNELCVVDYKSSKSLYPEVWLQTAAYQHAYQEEHPDCVVVARWGVNVGKDGALVAVRRDNETFHEDFQAFLGCAAIWHWNRSYGNDPHQPVEVIGSLEAIDGHQSSTVQLSEPVPRPEVRSSTAAA